MTAATPSLPVTADGVRARNAALDRELHGLAVQVPADALGRKPGGEEWTLAQLLAHIGEFASFFADDLGYVLGHKAAHVTQLRATLTAVADGT